MNQKPSDVRPGMYWLCHHQLILEWVDDYEGRVKYIRENKKPREIPRRLKWFRRVQGKLPADLVRAARAWRKRVDAYWKARDAAIDCLCQGSNTDMNKYEELAVREKSLERIALRADRRYVSLVKKHHRTIVRLFHQECPGCPWDGKQLMFPGRKKVV